MTSTQFLDVQIDNYIVVWTRVDGGTVASPTQTFPGDFIVPPSGSSTLTNYPYMSATTSSGRRSTSSSRSTAASTRRRDGRRSARPET